MSFINLLASDIWSDADITARTEAMINAQFPANVAAILNRKVTGSLTGQYSMTDDDKTLLVTYTALCEEARQAGIDATADMALLNVVLAYEQALSSGSNPAALTGRALTIYSLRNPIEVSQ